MRPLPKAPAPISAAVPIFLSDMFLVVHDWGSALGFHYAMRHEANVRGIAFLMTSLAAIGIKQLPPVHQLRHCGIRWRLVVPNIHSKQQMGRQRFEWEFVR